MYDIYKSVKVCFGFVNVVINLKMSIVGEK